jgi:hypothetical protein
LKCSLRETNSTIDVNRQFYDGNAVTSLPPLQIVNSVVAPTKASNCPVAWAEKTCVASAIGKTGSTSVHRLDAKEQTVMPRNRWTTINGLPCRTRFAIADKLQTAQNLGYT